MHLKSPTPALQGADRRSKPRIHDIPFMFASVELLHTAYISKQFV
jgi:hypothetical protein